MKCEQCSEKAAVYLTEIEDGIAQSHGFCLEHGRQRAKAMGLPVEEHFFHARVLVPVEVTQAQLDAEETVAVDLPDGRTKSLKLQRHWPSGLCITEVRKGSTPPETPLPQFRITVVA